MTSWMERTADQPLLPGRAPIYPRRRREHIATALTSANQEILNAAAPPARSTFPSRTHDSNLPSGGAPRSTANDRHEVHADSTGHDEGGGPAAGGYLQGISSEEIISTVHARRAPMRNASAGLAL